MHPTNVRKGTLPSACGTYLKSIISTQFDAEPRLILSTLRRSLSLARPYILTAPAPSVPALQSIPKADVRYQRAAPHTHTQSLAHANQRKIRFSSEPSLGATFSGIRLGNGTHRRLEVTYMHGNLACRRLPISNRFRTAL